MDKETLSKKKVNFLLDSDVVIFFDTMKKETGMTQAKVVSMLVHRYGAELAQDFQKYSKKGDTQKVSAYVE